jgi:hypothetical protein
MGAFSTSYRPTITGGRPNSRQAWGFARVNKFLLKKGGTKVKAAYVQDDDLMANGGKIGQEITCVNCGWQWNTNQSDEFDKYVCHRCGFDNRTFYDSDPIGKYHLGGDMSKHLAPNGKPSNLNHEQWHLVRTPEFKAWFGDWENNPKNASKVVDENGEPLVVYHGTTKMFNIFNIADKFREDWGVRDYGVYFSDSKKTAEIYSLDFTKPKEEYVKYKQELQNLAKSERFDEYKKLTGQEKPVQDFLEQRTKMDKYLNSVWDLIDITVENYLSRDFEHLMINFGCTGGQHRSVYAAEQTARHLRNKYKVKVNLTHTNSANWVR